MIRERRTSEIGICCFELVQPINRPVATESELDSTGPGSSTEGNYESLSLIHISEPTRPY